MRPRRPANLAMLLMVAVALAWAPAVASADGDPASDVLATQQLFLPADAGVAPRQQAELVALLQEASRRGYPIRVALIASATDLGSITELWRHPQDYAKFLGQELSLVYRGPLLIVMPNGLGLSNVASAVVGPTAAGVSSGRDLGTEALRSIQSLSRAAGHSLALPYAVASTSNGGGASTIAWVVLAAGAILIAAAWTLSLRMRPLELGRGKVRSA